MAKIVTIARTYADIDRGDIAAVFEDHEDEGRAVRETGLFRVVHAPGPKSAYAHLVILTPGKDGGPPPDKYFSTKVDLDAIESAEVARTKRPLADADNCSVETKIVLDSLVSTKPKHRGIDVLPPVSGGPV